MSYSETIKLWMPNTAAIIGGTEGYVEITLTNNSRSTQNIIMGDSLTITVNSIVYGTDLFGRQASRAFNLRIKNNATDEYTTLYSGTLSVNQVITFTAPTYIPDNESKYKYYDLIFCTHFNAGPFPWGATDEDSAGESLSIHIPTTYRPTVTITSFTTANNYHNTIPLAGYTTFTAVVTIGHQNPADTAPLELVVTSSTSEFTLVSAVDNVYTYTGSACKMIDYDYVERFIATVVDSRGYSTVAFNDTSIKGYRLPNIITNAISNNSYVSRTDENGNIDGFGEYGFAHVTWDVKNIDTTYPNTLQSITTTLNETTILTPYAGSIAQGYINYLFPLATTENGYLSIELEDNVDENTITSLVVPKQSMPLSLFDDGTATGVAMGAMATAEGCFVYMPFYLKSTNSNKMFRIKVDDSGVLTTEEYYPPTPPVSTSFIDVSDSVLADSVTITPSNALAGEELSIVIERKASTMFTSSSNPTIMTITDSVTTDLGDTYILNGMSSTGWSHTGTTWSGTVLGAKSADMELTAGNQYLVSPYFTPNGTDATVNIQLLDDNLELRRMIKVNGTWYSDLLQDGTGTVNVKTYDYVQNDPTDPWYLKEEAPLYICSKTFYPHHTSSGTTYGTPLICMDGDDNITGENVARYIDNFRGLYTVNFDPYSTLVGEGETYKFKSERILSDNFIDFSGSYTVSDITFTPNNATAGEQFNILFNYNNSSITGDLGYCMIAAYISTNSAKTTTDGTVYALDSSMQNFTRTDDGYSLNVSTNLSSSLIPVGDDNKYCITPMQAGLLNTTTANITFELLDDNLQIQRIVKYNSAGTCYKDILLDGAGTLTTVLTDYVSSDPTTTSKLRGDIYIVSKTYGTAATAPLIYVPAADNITYVNIGKVITNVGTSASPSYGTNVNPWVPFFEKDATFKFKTGYLSS